MTDRTDVMQRILNLRELAESSTSQAEALNAMKIAERMMHSYRIEEAELALAEGLGEIKVEIVDEVRWDCGLKVGRNRHKIQSLIWDIETFCEVEVVLKRRWDKAGLHVIGDKPDVELFWWMFAHLRDSMDRSYESWKRGQQGIGRGAKASFQLAFSDAVADRLRSMRAERRREQKAAEEAAAKALNRPVDEVRMDVSNGNLQALRSSMSLVVASAAEQKRKAVSDAYRAAYRNARLGTASGFGYRSGGSAAAAGRAAGGRVGLGRPVGGSAGKLLN